MRGRIKVIQKDLNKLIKERVDRLNVYIDVDNESLNSLIKFEKENKERIKELNFEPLTNPMITNYIRLRYNRITSDEVKHMENLIRGKNK